MIDDWLEGGADDDAGPGLIVDRHELGALTGFAPKEIDRLLREGLPTLPRSRGVPTTFRVPDVIQWIMRRQEDDGDTLDAAKRRERAAMARKRELEVAELERTRVPIDDVLAAITDGMARLQSEIGAIPNRLVVAPEVRDAVRAEIAAAFSRLSIVEKVTRS